MVNRPKAQGTRFETRIVRLLQEAGLYAHRLPEGGPNDKGDIEILTDRHWIIEAKDRQRLNIHDALAAATTKAPGKHVAVVWRRMSTRQPDQQRRHEIGEPIVAISLDTFITMLTSDADVTVPDTYSDNAGRIVTKFTAK